MKKNKVDMWTYLWNNPPAPFNPLFDPKAGDRYKAVTSSMSADNFYATHTREECKAEWARRYNDRTVC